MEKRCILLSLLIAISSIVSCFGIQCSIDNALKNIDVKIDLKYHNSEPSKEIKIKKANEKQEKEDQKSIREFLQLKERQQYFYDKNIQTKTRKGGNETHSVEVQLKIKDPKTGRDIYLTERRYNPLQRDVPCGIYFEERFMFHKKLAKIIYTISVDCVYKEGKHSIESVEVNIIEGMVGANEWPRTSSKQKLSSLL